MHTTATLHVHPAAANPFLIMEVRRLARDLGCEFIPHKPKLATSAVPVPFDPNGGGQAA